MSQDTIKTSCIRWNFLFTWIFGHLKRSKNPSFCEVPKDLELDKSLDLLQKFWNIELKKKCPSFQKALLKVIWPEIIFCSVTHSFSTIQKAFMAVMIKEIIDYLQKDHQEVNRGNLLIAGVVFSSFLMITVKSNAEYRLLLLIGKMKCLVSLMISQKSMKINSSSVQEGKVLNILSADLELFELFMYSPYIIGSPLIILVASLLLSYVISPSAIIGLAISVGHMPVIFILAIVGGKTRAKINNLGDYRIKILTNLVEGIKIFKFYAWELAYVSKICEVRKKEINQRYFLSNLNGLIAVLSLGGLGLCVYATFYIYLEILEVNLTLGEMYFIILIYISSHLSIVHMGTISILTLLVIRDVLKRIGDILLLPEYQPETKQEDLNHSISLENVSVSTKLEYKSEVVETNANLIEIPNTFILSNLTCELEKGELMIVIGSVGSGKSALLKLLQGELKIFSGIANINGKISYCSESPWIISSTIKENILMGAEMDSERYSNVIKSSALDKDIEGFLMKDKTLIGDRGITLSGGQKSRINLARSLYRDFDILLLDDPLSSVDAQVANHIFNETILTLLKQKKTIVLVTHQLQFLSKADKILLLENGTVHFLGRYEQLAEQAEILSKIKQKEFGEDLKAHEQLQSIYEANGEIEFIQEEMNESLKIKTIFRYFQYGFRNFFFISVGIGMIVGNQVIFQEFLYWCSHRDELPDKSNEFFLNGLGLWLMGIYVAQEISAIYLMNLITRCNHQIHDKSLKGLACTAISFFDNNPSGRIINRFSKDVTNSDGPLQFFLFDAVNTVGLVVSSIVVQLIVIPYITIVVPFYLVLQALIFCKVSWLIGKLRKKENLAKAPILSLTTSILEGLITIRTQRLESKFTSDMKEKVNHYYQCFITYQSYMRFNQLYSDLAGLLIVIVNIILIVKDQSIISASLAAYSLTASINIVSISSIATKDLLEISALMFSPQHLLEYKDLEPEKILSTKTFKITQGSISFEDISLQYQPHLPLVLHNLNFSITPGEKIGIVGRTGSGKSSILQVLCRLTEPASGTVLIDGKDYKTLGLHDLRRQISIIPQSSVLFSTSLRDNFDPLGLFHDDEIWKVLKLVGLDQLVISENGLNSPVGSEGIKFSAGQKQLVCIARAILVNNKIVLLDEATSNIDVQTDESIQKIIKSQFKDSTLIVIAHRLLTAADSDRILVMDEGKVVEFARPSDLIEKGSGHFFNLCESAGLTRFHFKN